MSLDKEHIKRAKVIDGRMMQGICIQWFVDTYGYGSTLNVYAKILRDTFGLRRRYAFIKSDSIPGSRRGRLADLDFLEENGIISRKQSWNKSNESYGFVRYEVLQPADSIQNFSLEVDTKYTAKSDEKTKAVWDISNQEF